MWTSEWDIVTHKIMDVWFYENLLFNMTKGKQEMFEITCIEYVLIAPSHVYRAGLHRREELITCALTYPA